MLATPERQSVALRNTHLINVEEVRRTYDLHTTSGQIVEIRALEASLDSNGRFTRTFGGYFDNPDDLIKAISTIRVAMGIYITLHPCHPDMLHRAKNKLVEQKKDSSTPDKYITGYRWLAIDCDPERVSGISSTEEEHQKALAMCRKIREALIERGWPEPVLADSGNGGHLLYRIDLPTSDAQLVKRTLEGLQEFNEDDVHVDLTLFNPSRIIKLYGTLACKGDNTEERPHRLSRILEAPNELQVVSREQLEAIAIPIEQQKEPVKMPSNGHKSQYSHKELLSGLEYMKDFIARHGIETVSEEPYNGGTKFRLARCVSDPTHTDNAAYLYVASDGKLGAKCSHNSCSGLDWQSVRLRFEPDAYDRRNTTDQKAKENSHTSSENTAKSAKDEAPNFAIQDKRVLKALIEKRLQDLYALAPEIADMEAMEQSRIKLAAHDIWKKDFPSREFDSLLRVAWSENERKRQTKPVIFSARELMNMHFAPVDYVVPDILPTGLIVLAGKQKIGKSWIDLNLAIAVASGGKAFSKYEVKQGNVLYMALEDNQRRLQDRINVLLTPQGSQVPDALDIVTTWPRMDKDGIALLEQWIVSHPNARLVIIDPWVMVKPVVKVRPGSTGYDAEYEAFAGIKALADKYEICILVQFHLRKAMAEDYVDTINATTGVTACADGFLVLQRLRGEEDASLRGTGRDFKEDVDMVLKFNSGIWSIPGDNNPVYYKLNAERRAVIDLLNESAGPMLPKDIANLLRVRPDAMRQLLKKMKDSDQVEDTGNGYKSLISTTPPKDDPFPGWKESNSAKSDHGDHTDHTDHTDHGDHATSNGIQNHADHAADHAPTQGINEPVAPAQEVIDPDIVTDVISVISVIDNCNSDKAEEKTEGTDRQNSSSPDQECESEDECLMCEASGTHMHGDVLLCLEHYAIAKAEAETKFQSSVAGITFSEENIETRKAEIEDKSKQAMREYGYGKR